MPLQPLRSILSATVVGLVAAGSLSAQSEPTIHEFLASNSEGIVDFEGDHSDWIELHNPTNSTKSLNGWYLTDDETDLTKWELPNISLSPDEFLVVFASGKSLTNPSNELHTNFNLNKDGEYLALVKSNGTTIAYEYAPTYPQQYTDLSYGINPNGDLRYFTGPSPGYTHAGLGWEGVVSDIQFSTERGVVSGSTTVQITTDPPDANIRFRTDGSEPTTTSGHLYTGPISIGDTTVLRVIAYKDGYLETDVLTHTYISPGDVIDQPWSVSGYPNNWYDVGEGSAVAQHDYQMDPSIVGNPAYAADLIDGLLEIPSMSIACPPDVIFGGGGFYDGTDVEHAVSVEVIYPNDPDSNHQADCGIESHSHKRLKRSLRLNFRSEFGDAKFHTDLFSKAPLNGDSAADAVDRVVLRAGNNRSWARNWNPEKTNYTLDQFYRDSQIAMSGFGSRGTFVHLYINGLYWGLYNAVERPDEWFTSSYFGGGEDHWLANNHGGTIAGDPSRYNYLINNLAWQNMSNSGNYAELQEYLSIDDFIDYITLNFWTATGDWPANNWYGGNRNPTSIQGSTPHRYFAWDGEWSWNAPFGFQNPGGQAHVHPLFEEHDSGGPDIARLWHAARQNDEFMMRFADRVHLHVHNGGALSEVAALTRWVILNSFIENAIVAESARWGDALENLGHPTRTRNDDWYPHALEIAELMDGNDDELISALRAEDYYPSFDAPIFSKHGGMILPGHQLTISSPDGKPVYYTINGVDPRLEGGAIAPSAQLYSSPFSLLASVTIRARAKDGSEWSALTEATFATGLDLRISEILADNGNVIADSAGDFEDYIEIHNASAVPVTLDGMYLTDDLAQPLKWGFPTGTTLPQGAYMLVWADEEPGEGPMHANFKLSKSGELVALYQQDGTAPPILLDGVIFGPQDEDVSTGTLPDTSTERFRLMDPSPGAANVPPEGRTVRYNAALANQNPILLEPLTDPISDGTFVLEISNAPPQEVGIAAIGGDPIQLPTGATDTLLILPYPQYYLVFLTDSQGEASVSIEVPGSASFVGLTFYFQSIVDDGLSTAVIATVGP